MPKILLIPFVGVESGIVDYLRKGLRKTFRAIVEIGPPVPLSESGYNSDRRQYNASVIIRELGNRQKKRF